MCFLKRDLIILKIRRLNFFQCTKVYYTELTQSQEFKDRYQKKYDFITTTDKFGTDMYTLQNFKWITNKNLLYSTWNSAQCYVAAWMRGEFGGK